MSTDNALVIQKSKRFTLLIDPEMQGVTFLKSQFEGPGNLYVLKQTDQNFKKMMEMAQNPLQRMASINSKKSTISMRM